MIKIYKSYTKALAHINSIKTPDDTYYIIRFGKDYIVTNAYSFDLIRPEYSNDIVATGRLDKVATLGNINWIK